MASQPDWPGRPGQRDWPQRASRPVTPLRTFTADPRMPVWIRRAILSAIAGIVLGFLLGWRLGLTAAVVVAILDTIHRSRTTAVLPAAVRMTSAQRRTRRRLRTMSRRGYHALHGYVLPSGRVIDHLVIGPAGVFALTSQRWDRRLPIRATQGGQAGQLFHGPFSQAALLHETHRQASAASKLLSQALGSQLTVRPAVLIYGPKTPWTMVAISGTDVMRGRRVRKYLRSRARTLRDQRLSTPEIDRILTAAERALPSRSGPTG